MNNTIKNTLSPGSFFMVNKVLAQYFKSNDAAVVISHLVFLDGLFEGREFYQQQERLAKDCNVAIHTLRVIIKKLTQEGIITVVKKGLPAKNYYKLNLKVLEKILYHEEVEELNVETIKQEVETTEVEEKVTQKVDIPVEKPKTSYRVQVIKEEINKISNPSNITLEDLEHVEKLEFKKPEDFTELDNRLLQRLEAYIMFD